MTLQHDLFANVSDKHFVGGVELGNEKFSWIYFGKYIFLEILFCSVSKNLSIKIILFKHKKYIFVKKYLTTRFLNITKIWHGARAAIVDSFLSRKLQQESTKFHKPQEQRSYHYCRTQCSGKNVHSILKESLRCTKCVTALIRASFSKTFSLT